MIWELLPTGKHNKVTAAALMKATGIQTKRELSAIVQRERMAGLLICSTKSDGGGYYRAANPAEAQEFINTFTGEAKALFAMQKAFRKYVKASEVTRE